MVREPVLRRLLYSGADALESRAPVDWLWLGRHVKMANGTTLLTADTDANQAVWPQQRSQKPGVGFPIMRMVVLRPRAFVRRLSAWIKAGVRRPCRKRSFAAGHSALQGSDQKFRPAILEAA